MKKQIQILVIILCLGIGAKGQSHGNDLLANDYFQGKFSEVRFFDAGLFGDPAQGGKLLIGGNDDYRGITWNALNASNGDFKYIGTRTSAGMVYTHWNSKLIWRFSTDAPALGDNITWQTGLSLERMSAGDMEMKLCGKFFANEININANITWCDYVFADDYKLMSLPALEAYIKENKHLPEVPSEKEVMENGISVIEMLQIQMKKIEELTLYIIALQKQLDELKNK